MKGSLIKKQPLHETITNLLMFDSTKENIKEIKRRVKRKLRHENLSFHRVWLLLSTSRGRKRIFNFGYKVTAFAFSKIFHVKIESNRDYKKWLNINLPDAQKLNQYKNEISEFKYQPKISIVLPVYNTPLKYLNAAVESVINQIYENWELCISDDNSSDNEVLLALQRYSATDPRIRIVFRKENGHISLNSNSALEISTGDYIALLDHDDLLTSDALFQNVKVLNENSKIDFIYSDEDKIDDKGNSLEPHFKPDWCPENFMSRNYMCHFSVIRKSLVEEVGGFRAGYEGSQDYDLFLRVTEKTNRIHHIPMILYHWRIHPGSTANLENAKPYAYISGKKALEDALIRRGLEGKVENENEMSGYYHIRYALKKTAKVSIIIPSKNRQDMCEMILSSLTELTEYPDYEIILVNNNSDEPGFFEMTDRWKKRMPDKFQCIDDNGTFNFSRLINRGAEVAKGEYLLLLNNDTKVIQADWMELMAGYAQMEPIGAVGVRLLFPDDTIQHAGVVIGLGGIAEHVFAGTDKNENGYFNFLKCTNNYSGVTAACLMVRKNVFTLVGGFDENLPVEYNDIDFCLKLVDAGYRNVYLPYVSLYHFESVSRGHPHKTKESYQQHLNDIGLFKSRWQKYIENDPCYNPHLSRIYNDFRLRIND